MSHFKNPSVIIAFLIGALLFGSRLVLSFTSPSAEPPGNNVPAPVNVGSQDQTKQGGLTLGGILRAADVCAGSVCLSSLAPQEEGESPIPSGAIMFFNSNTCPFGWHEVVAARGRYLVGLPSGGSLGSGAGTALGNLENRPTGSHTHSYTDVVGSATGYFGDKCCIGGHGNSSFSTQTKETGSGSGLLEGTNAPYIQYLTCEKN